MYMYMLIKMYRPVAPEFLIDIILTVTQTPASVSKHTWPESRTVKT